MEGIEFSVTKPSSFSDLVSCDHRCAPPIELVVQARLDDVKALGLADRDRHVECPDGRTQSTDSVPIARSKIEVVIFNEGRPIRRERIFYACAECPSGPRLALAKTRDTAGATKVRESSGSRSRHGAVAFLPSPTTFRVDQSAIDRCTDATRDAAKALYLVIAAKTKAKEPSRIEATTTTVDISPMSVAIPLVAVGTAEALRAIQSDDQMANRFSPFPLPVWRDGDEYLRLLSSLEALLPLRRPSQLAELPLAGRILTASEGVLGEIVTLVTMGAAVAVTSGEEAITEYVLDRTGFVAPSRRKRIAV